MRVSGFVPVNFTVPLMEPAVAGSTAAAVLPASGLLAAGLSEAAAGGGDAVPPDLLSPPPPPPPQPTAAINSAGNAQTDRLSSTCLSQKLGLPAPRCGAPAVSCYCGRPAAAVVSRSGRQRSTTGVF